MVRFGNKRSDASVVTWNLTLSSVSEREQEKSKPPAAIGARNSNRMLWMWDSHIVRVCEEDDDEDSDDDDENDDDVNDNDDSGDEKDASDGVLIDECFRLDVCE